MNKKLEKCVKALNELTEITKEMENEKTMSNERFNALVFINVTAKFLIEKIKELGD